MGYTGSLDEIGKVPAVGWSPTKDVRLILGHTYAVQTWDYHYAKIRVIDVSPANVTLDWAYQLQEGNRYLKAHSTAGRGVHEPGPGVLTRR